MSPIRRAVCLSLLTSLVAGPVAAQALAWSTQATLYGDNTEFFTPYRTGETILGGQFHSSLRFRPGEQTSFRAGVFGDHRSGAAPFLDPIRPLLSFQYRSGGSTGTMGALLPERRRGYLEALAVSTLELTRPVEYGLEWQEQRRHFDADVFINWQQLNLVGQREVFDYGWVVRVRPLRRLTLEHQLHGLHHGGQLYDAGVPVTNNVATALGATWSDSLPIVGRGSLGVFRLRSSGNIDPGAPAGRPRSGRGWLLRVAVAPRGWFELFSVSWWGRDFLAQEGDNNYSSVGADPAYYRARRKYWELGIQRRSRLEGGVEVDAEFRLHRIDHLRSIALGKSRWEYSYRLVARAPFDLVLRERR